MDWPITSVFPGAGSSRNMQYTKRRSIPIDRISVGRDGLSKVRKMYTWTSGTTKGGLETKVRTITYSYCLGNPVVQRSRPSTSPKTSVETMISDSVHISFDRASTQMLCLYTKRHTLAALRFSDWMTRSPKRATITTLPYCKQHTRGRYSLTERTTREALDEQVWHM